MKKEDIYLGDIKRILFGQAPPEFLLETFIRTAIMYVLLLAIVRILGKRMKGQLTITEMAVLIMLGAIVSVPMQVPDRGLLQGVIILIATVLFQRGLTWLGVKSNKVEELTVGKGSTLVKDGVIQHEILKEAAISREELFAAIRSRKILHLGTVERVYMEACGLFSIYKTEEKRPGLPVLPDHDEHVLAAQQKAPADIRACHYCGNVQQEEKETDCNECGHNQWVPAII